MGRWSSRGVTYQLVVFLVVLLFSESLAKKKKHSKGLPDIEKLAQSAFSPTFAAELANVSKAATKLKYWEEYDTVSTALVRLLMREAEKGTRELHIAVVNRDRQFNQQGDMGRYSEVLDFMLKGKEGAADAENMMGAAMGCLPMRERFCVEKLGRAARLGSWITVENCHRWFQATMLLPEDGGSAGFDLPDISVDWQKVCTECFSQRLQVSVVARRAEEEECLQLPDQEAESLSAQVGSNWTIDISTRTSIGGMRMEERKLLPIGPRWVTSEAVQAVILQELVEGGIRVRELSKEGVAGPLITADDLRDRYPETITDFAISLW